MRLETNVNGRPFGAEVPATASLLEVLRDAGLTGTKEGCRIGVCGVCTVIVNGLPVSSCLYLAGCAQGADVRTVEGVAEHQPELAEAFIACEGMQCGICTPGQVVTAASMGPEVQGEDEVRQYLSGNLCRCTGYASIVEAVRAYQSRKDAGTSAPPLPGDGAGRGEGAAAGAR
ncbi:MAG TPA: 2Fe-2S iron-sulfur cluster-binding protein [Streptosporangiaceae bacterium]|nr:2Fe-2S iron-sulfur cluster-binding protein [Streptosporangiaceae bacterium]